MAFDLPLSFFPSSLSSLDHTQFFLFPHIEMEVKDSHVVFKGNTLAPTRSSHADPIFPSSSDNHPPPPVASASAEAHQQQHRTLKLGFPPAVQNDHVLSPVLPWADGCEGRTQPFSNSLCGCCLHRAQGAAGIQSLLANSDESPSEPGAPSQSGQLRSAGDQQETAPTQVLRKVSLIPGPGPPG